MDNSKGYSVQAAPETKLHFLDYWRIIRVRKTVIFAVFLLVVMTTTMVTFFLTESYSSTARIEVDKDTLDVEGLGGGRQAASGFDPYWMQTQFEIMQSQIILYRVIEKLNLNEKYTRRYSTPDQPLRTDETFGILRRKVSLSQSRNTTLIEIRVFSEDRQEAADIANTVAQAYKEYRQESRKDLATRGIASLEEQLRGKSNEVERLQAQVDYLSKQLEISEIDPYSMRMAGTLDQDTLRRLEGLRVEADADKVQLEKLYNELKDKSRDELRKTIPIAVPDPLLQGLLTDYNSAKQKQALLAPDYGAEHPEVLRINKLIQTCEAQINERLEGVLSGLSTRLASYTSRAKTLTDQVEDAKRKERIAIEKIRPYQAAKENLEMAKQIKNALSLRVSQVEVDNLKMPTSSMVKVVDNAEPSMTPVRPNKTLNISLGVVVGLILGVGLAFFIEYLDTSVKTIDDVERALQAPVLGVIPQNVSILLEAGPESPHAEPYRVLRTNLLFSRKDDRLNTITLVSGGAGEGKSTTLFNLATIFAQNGSRVLIVDSDLRRPSLHKLFKVSNSIGLTSCLLKQNSLVEVIQTTPIPTLDFMPSGKLPSSSIGILSSPQMKELVYELKRRYDFVFFDSPPIMGVSDASVLASMVDMTLQVIQYRRYPQPMTIRAKQLVEKVGGNLLGIVLNNINMSQDENYYYYSGYFEDYYSSKENLDTSDKETKKPSADKNAAKAAASPEIKQKY
ncbi:MAG: polysaccharide biosynthesis tyrosine autokinase [Verrucomicrobiota bacterium]